MKNKIRIAILLFALLIGAVIFKITMTGKNFLYAGTVEATKVDLSSRLATTVSAVTVREGEEVTADQILVRLSSEDLKLAADSAASDFERAKKLLKSGSIPQERYDHLKTKRDETAIKLSWATIKSPIDGTVLNVYRENSEWVSPGQRIVTVADLKSVWAMIYVPQPILAKISLNMPVDAFLPELENQRFPGKITWISDEAEFTPKNVQTRAERTRLIYAVKISFENSNKILKPGMTVEVKLPE